MPDSKGYPDQQCILHEEWLKKIDTAIDEERKTRNTSLKQIELSMIDVNRKLDMLLSMDGPVGKVRERVSIVEQSDKRAHARIDGLEKMSKEESRRINALAVKIGSIAALGSTLAGFIVQRMF